MAQAHIPTSIAPLDSAAISAVLSAGADLRLAIQFGSAAAGRLGATSDVDIAVLGSAPFDAARKQMLMSEMALATGRPVDLIDLRSVGEPLLGQVLRSGQRLFGSDADHAALLSRHLIETADFMPYVDRLLAERRRARIG